MQDHNPCTACASASTCPAARRRLALAESVDKPLCQRSRVIHRVATELLAQRSPSPILEIPPGAAAIRARQSIYHTGRSPN